MGKFSLFALCEDVEGLVGFSFDATDKINEIHYVITIIVAYNYCCLS